MVFHCAMTESISVRLAVQQLEQLAALSAATDWTQADLIRTGIDLLLERRDRVQPRRPLRETRR
jgi:Ribbon-helix-helix domain